MFKYNKKIFILILFYFQLMGSPAIVKGGWLRGIDKPKGTLIRIQNNTFDRMKLNSTQNGEVETVSEIIDRLLDNWDRNHQR